MRASDDRAALGEVGVDALGGAHPADLVDASSRIARVLGERGVAVAAAGQRPSEAGNSAEHQPPLRPDAPNPAISASSTAIRSAGSASAR